MAAHDGRFPTTHWTLIARLKSVDERESRRALDELCAQYHYPLYCYIRRRGLGHYDAQDALHDFLAKLLRLDSLKQADADKGKLRTFLATALQRFLVNRHRDEGYRTDRMGVGDEVEERFGHEQFTDAMTPEKVLEQCWAAEVLKLALNDLAQAEDAAGRGEQFKVLEPLLGPHDERDSYSSVAQKLGSNEVAARQSIKRLRERFRTHLRRRVAETLGKPTREEVDEELRVLRAAIYS